MDAPIAEGRSCRSAAMATLVFVHAHPDDEASQTGGSIARASAEGHRVVLVVCTDGDHGESPDDLATGRDAGRPAPGGDGRRRRRCSASPGSCGSATRDSGMTGWEQNDDPASFWRADVDEAAGRLADVLRESRPTSSSSTTGTAATAIRTTSRSTASASGRRPAGTPRRSRPRSTATRCGAGRACRGRRPESARSSTRTGRPTTATRSARRRPSCTWRVDVGAYVDQQAGGAGRPRQPGRPTSACCSACRRERVRRWRSAPSGTSSPAPPPGLRRRLAAGRRAGS